MRVLVFTGKGGVGTTTAAAATATFGALRGMHTLVISTDAAHSLADVFDVQVGPDPTEVDDGLYAQQIDAQRRLERCWDAFGEPLTRALGRTGTSPVYAEEAIVVPGVEELMVLLEIGIQLRSGHWDLVVIDGAPTAHALRLLALPDTLMRYLYRLAGARGLHSVADGAADPDPASALYAELAETRELLAGPNSSVRLVLTPEFVVAAEARRAYTTLALYGYQVDGVIANRLFPRGADPWRRQWNAAQDVVLGDVEQAFAGTPIYRSPYRVCEPVGLGELAAFAAEAYGSSDPFSQPDREDLLQMERHGSGGYELRFVLPNVRGTDLSVTRKEDQLALTVGSYRRVLTLPEELRQAEVVGASLLDGQLVVRFRHAIDRQPQAGPMVASERGSLRARGGARGAGVGHGWH